MLKWKGMKIEYPYHLIDNINEISIRQMLGIFNTLGIHLKNLSNIQVGDSQTGGL